MNEEEKMVEDYILKGAGAMYALLQSAQQDEEGVDHVSVKVLFEGKAYYLKLEPVQK